ncbi:hypothetical protein B0H16DRAFT_1454533 [Mycena metata]|uniref:Uncharacterized protein n=1 Tax=Mycena metata TaxID=1033252 RepID=A0AAD7NKX0_9AGAR|nr:hypothetical protein B0H16DRAFT_1454533 [Mycena metata]
MNMTTNMNLSAKGWGLEKEDKQGARMKTRKACTGPGQRWQLDCTTAVAKPAKGFHRKGEERKTSYPNTGKPVLAAYARSLAPARKTVAWNHRETRGTNGADTQDVNQRVKRHASTERRKTEH